MTDSDIVIHEVYESQGDRKDARLEVMSRLTGGVAHDLKGILRLISGNLSIARESSAVKSNPEVTAQLASLEHAVSKAEKLTRQLMDYSRRAELSKSALDTAEMIHQIISCFSKKSPSSLVVHSEIEGDVWSIDAEEPLIREVIANILKNSEHATDGVGNIHLTARNFVLAEQSLSNAFDCKPGEYVIITIADDGCGMSGEVLEKVFEPFFTTKEPGQADGLGLANSYAIIRQHGGHITCTSVEGRGTAISLYLPKFIAEIETEPCLAAVDLPTKRERGVLVVEDEDLLRNLVRTLCEKNGYRTFGAADGLEALEFINENRDEIFVAVLDLAMPRMTGNELFRELNAAGSNLPVIVASGFLVDPGKFIEETGGEPYAIFSKPYQLSELITRINELRDRESVVMAS